MPEGWLTDVTIGGFRGFRTLASLICAQPTGEVGSGLTLLVGPNNAGKSTVLEAIKLAGNSQQPEIGRGVRNVPYGDRASIRFAFEDGTTHELRSVQPGSYLTEWKGRALADDGSGLIDLPGSGPPRVDRLYTVPARRSISAHFGRGNWTRTQYASNSAQLAADRNENPTLNNRLITIVEDRAAKQAFDETVEYLLGHPLRWELDRLENGNYVFAIDGPTGHHTSDGLGFGILSVFYLVAGAFDALEGTILCIDEPELSMHPQIQRRVADYLAAQAARLQVIVSTHSPYFVDPTWLAVGAELSRCYVRNASSQISRLAPDTKQSIRGLVRDLNNPHVLGIDAREIFFAEEGVLVVEGQEDVVILRRIAAALGAPLPPSFFGWGAGGAEKVRIILAVLRDLGFERVTTLLDGDKADTSERLRADFPAYRHYVLPADDIRDKPEQHRAYKAGLCTDRGELKPEFENVARELLAEIALPVALDRGD